MLDNCSICTLGCDFYVLLSAWLQVFVDGMEPARKPLERMFEDSTSEKSVSEPCQMCYFIFCLFIATKMNLKKSQLFAAESYR